MRMHLFEQAEVDWFIALHGEQSAYDEEMKAIALYNKAMLAKHLPARDPSPDIVPDSLPEPSREPLGKARCRFIGVNYPGGPCKNCVYQCQGYGAHVVWQQAVEKPCMSIDPASGLVNTGEIDPKCGGRPQGSLAGRKDCSQ